MHLNLTRSPFMACDLAHKNCKQSCQRPLHGFAPGDTPVKRLTQSPQTPSPHSPQQCSPTKSACHACGKNGSTRPRPFFRPSAGNCCDGVAWTGVLDSCSSATPAQHTHLKPHSARGTKANLQNQCFQCFYDKFGKLWIMIILIVVFIFFNRTTDPGPT